jgi:integrase
MLKEPEQLPGFVTPEHFAAIDQACDHAKLPRGLPNMPAADWWRGLIVFADRTGWRVSELLAVRRADGDLEAGTALTRHRDNKGKRDERVHLHPVILDHRSS